MDHIGIDVHKRESQICILAEGGELIERRIRTEPQRFAEALGGRAPARILLESSTESEWVARCLEALGHHLVVADPNFAPVSESGRLCRRGRDPARGTRRWRVLVFAIVSAGYPAAPARPPRRPVSGSLDAARHQSRRGRGDARSRRHQGGPGSLPDGGPPSPPAIALAATPVDLPDHLCHHCAALDHAEQPAGSESTTQ